MKPARFGKVLAAGYGTPSDDVRREMEQRNGLFHDMQPPTQPDSHGKQKGEPQVFVLPRVDVHLIDIVPDHNRLPPCNDFEIHLPDER